MQQPLHTEHPSESTISQPSEQVLELTQLCAEIDFFPPLTLFCWSLLKTVTPSKFKMFFNII
jgi:hypothetical protein